MQPTSVSPAIIKHGPSLLAHNAVLPYLLFVSECYMQVVKLEFTGWLPAQATRGTF